LANTKHVDLQDRA